MIKLNAATRLLSYDKTWIEKQKRYRESHPKYQGQQTPSQLKDEKIFNMAPSALSQELQNVYKNDYRGAAGALNLYKNRMGKNLKTPDQARLDKAKDELKKRYGRDDDKDQSKAPTGRNSAPRKGSKPIGSKPTGKIV